MELNQDEKSAVERLASRFDLDATCLRLLHHGEGIVIESRQGNDPMILKLIRTEATDVIQARLNWMCFLHQNGVLVPDLRTSASGNRVEQVKVNGVFYAAYAYREFPLSEESEIHWEAPGKMGLPYQLGYVIGQMHRLAKLYRPEPLHPCLGHWFEGDWLRNPAEVLHPSQGAVVEAILRLRKRIAQFPVGSSVYGLIHDDLHTGNVYAIHGRLAIIDFDNCHYSWFAADLAAALLFRVWIGPGKEKPGVPETARRFLESLVEGYLTQESLPDGWQAMLPVFLKLREASLYQSFFRDVDVSRGKQDPFFEYVFDSVALEKPFLPVTPFASGMYT